MAVVKSYALGALVFLGQSASVPSPKALAAGDWRARIKYKFYRSVVVQLCDCAVMRLCGYAVVRSCGRAVLRSCKSDINNDLQDLYDMHDMHDLHDNKSLVALSAIALAKAGL